MTIYTPAAQRISEWGKGKKERNSVTAGAGGPREDVRNYKETREGTGKDRAKAQETKPESAVIGTVIGTS